MYSLDLDGIKRITITDTGITSIAGENLKISCEEFILTKKNLLEYFRIAKRVNRNDYRHKLDWSPCYVKGKIYLDDGEIGGWGIHQYRGGVINFDSGETIYMYCPTCEAKTFDNPKYLSN